MSASILAIFVPGLTNPGIGEPEADKGEDGSILLAWHWTWLSRVLFAVGFSTEE
jgi:hypothetical protein